MRIVGIVLSFFVLLVPDTTVAQLRGDWYEAAVAWVAHSSEVKEIICRNGGMPFKHPDDRLQFAVSDSIGPIPFLGFYFDSVSCAEITEGSKRRPLVLDESGYLCLDLEYCPLLAKFWNERDTLILVFGRPFHNMLSAHLYRRGITNQNVSEERKIPPMAVKGDWKPRGRPRNHESSFVGLIFCFNEAGCIGNVHVREVYH